MEYIWHIITILSFVVGIVLLIYSVWEYMQSKKVGALQVNRNTQISWKLAKELPVNLNIYTSAVCEDYTVYCNILNYCGFDTKLGLFRGAKFDNENWWVECNGEEVCFHSKRRNKEKETKLLIDESKMLAEDFLTKLGVDLQNYAFLGHTIGDVPCILLWGNLFEEKYAADMPYAIEIGFFDDKNLAYISMVLEKVVTSGVVKAISFDKLKKRAINMNWYNSNKAIYELGQIQKLRVTNYEITYSQIGDNRYLPYIQFFGEVDLCDTVAIEVNSEIFPAYRGKISKLASESGSKVDDIIHLSSTVNETLINDVANAYFRLAVMQKEKGDMYGAIESVEKSVTYLNEVHESDLMTSALTLALELYEMADKQEYVQRCRERLQKLSDTNRTNKGEKQ